MGRVVAVTNIKGGIGKTTTVVNVGSGLALKGARVLLADVDAQGNLATALGLKPRRTIYEVLVDGVDPVKCITEARPNLDLLAADDSLLSAQPLLSQRPDWSRVLEQKLAPLKKVYDFIIIDAPGSLTVLSVNALSASSDLIVPTTIETLSIKGLDMLFKQVTRLKVSTRSVRTIVPTMFDARLKQSVQLLEQLRQTYGNLVAQPVRVNVKLSEATSQGKTIYEYDPRSRGALDYALLVDYLSNMWNFQPPPRPRPTPAAPTVANGADHRVPSAAAPLNGTLNTTSHAGSNGHRTSDPIIIGSGTMMQDSCPHCGRPLRRATVAGYRVAFCDHCKYKQQELISNAR